MRLHFLIGLFALAFVSVRAEVRPGDTSSLPSIRYTKKELKKEMEDLKDLDKQVKEWNKAIKQNNPDYLNVVFGKCMKLMEKEHSELSNRVSQRSKQLVPQPSTNKTNSSGTDDDKPQVYNSELKDQIVHVDKKEIMKKKAESDYLSKYITVIRNEKAVMNKLKNVKSFDQQTPSSTYQQISTDLQTFRKEMSDEIELMKKETGKK